MDFEREEGWASQAAGSGHGSSSVPARPGCVSREPSQKRTGFWKFSAFPGLFENKVGRLNAVARAALAGDLEAHYLRALPVAEALEHLKHLPGIGPFGAELILLRGAGHPDYLTLLEPRFRAAVQRVYGMDRLPTDDELRRITDKWRPYRMWVTFLLRQAAA